MNTLTTLKSIATMFFVSSGPAKTTLSQRGTSKKRRIMNPLIQPKQRTLVFLVAFGLACLGLSPVVQAVNPAPDGCDPNFNTAEGCDALNLLTTGEGNTALGWRSLFSNTGGSFNTAVGAAALILSSGSYNTAVGVSALLLDTTGSFNDAFGVQALFNNTTGAFNSAIGGAALFTNTEGHDDVAVGGAALFFNQTGSENTAIGRQALEGNTTADDNTAVGFQALNMNQTGHNNTAVGVGALVQNVSGSMNTAIGNSAGAVITGDGNVIIGNLFGEAGVSNSTYIANIGVTSQPVGGTVLGVTVDTNTGKLGFAPSSRRYKEDIKPMDKASEGLFVLKPVTFRYKNQIDPKQRLDYGLIAEDVAEVNPELAIRNKKGEIESLNYGAIYAMLLNEFLKEHKTVQEQGATITQQRKDFKAAIAQQQNEIEALIATVKEQASQIQKVSTQVELNKSTPQIALNNR
jgi:hypothetical protein